MLSQGSVPQGEWRPHPQMIQMIWDVFWKAEVDHFDSEDNSHWPIFFSKERDTLAHKWPNAHLYDFSPIALLPLVIRKVKEVRCSVLLVAPHWRIQSWFPELIQLLSEAPWLFSLRKDLLYSARGTIWHPQTSCGDYTCGPSMGAFAAPREGCQYQLEPHLRDASMPSNGLYSLTGVQSRTKSRLPVAS